MWTNNKADERRRRDQVAEDQRRRDERKGELYRAELVRQREEVNRCISTIRSSAEATFRSSRESIAEYSQRILDGDPVAKLEYRAIQGQRRSEFYLSAINATERLRLELVHPIVRKHAAELSRIFYEENENFRRLREADVSEWLDSNASARFLSEESNQAIVTLAHSAFEHLHLSRYRYMEKIDEH